MRAHRSGGRMNFLILYSFSFALSWNGGTLSSSTPIVAAGSIFVMTLFSFATGDVTKATSSSPSFVFTPNLNGRSFSNTFQTGLDHRPPTNISPPLPLHQIQRQKQKKDFLSRHSSSLTLSQSSDSKSKVKNSRYRFVIVESPSKAKTIEKLLNTGSPPPLIPYHVDSCMGHIRDLPKSTKQLGPREKIEKEKNPILGVRTSDKSYDPTYVILPQKEDIIDRLRDKCKVENGCQEVIFATDNDREGEAISWHLKQVLLGKTNKGQLKIQQNYRRVTFNEITPSAITEAFQRKDIKKSNLASNDIESTEAINMNLVAAQETRRILDRLAGYTFSPVLWKKIAPGLSAGRVQSVGLNFIVQRELERMKFRAVEYWDTKAEFQINENESDEDICDESNEENNILSATLVEVNGQRVATGKDFDGEGNMIVSKDRGNVVHFTCEKMNDLLARFIGIGDGKDLNKPEWKITSLQTRARKYSPPLPFITSTLQQESNNKLGLSAQETMSCAQSLYEGGYISYMRTDNAALSADAIENIQRTIIDTHGIDYVATNSAIEPSKSSKRNTGKKQNIQEAHEAIRPTLIDGVFVHPNSLSSSPKTKSQFSPSALRLYNLIYMRTFASQMSPQIMNQTTVFISGKNGNNELIFRTSGSSIVFPGYTAAYGNSDMENILPKSIFEGKLLDSCTNITAISHSTQPSPRYSEASFIKELERVGVGRPSTYASVITTLRERSYIGTPVGAGGETAISRGRKSIKKNKGNISARRAAGGDEFVGSGRGPLVPSLTAFVVCSLLEKYCPSYLDSSFTATMENRLDEIAKGPKGDSKNFDAITKRRLYLSDYYDGENGLANLVKHFDETVSSDEARRVHLPSLSSEEVNVGLFIGPWGPFVRRLNTTSSSSKTQKSTSLPLGMASDMSKITIETLQTLISMKETDGVVLGTYPPTGQSIYLKISRFGAYLQLGDDNFPPISSHSLPRNVGGMGGRNLSFNSTSTITELGLNFEEIVGYVALPRHVCELEGKSIEAGLGPYGPYLRFNSSYVSLPAIKDHYVLYIEPEEAIDLVREGIINKTSKFGRGVLAEIGEKDGALILVKSGRYGYYVNWRSVNAKLPPQYLSDPSTIPYDEAWNLIQEKKISPKAGIKSKSSKKIGIELPSPPKKPLSAYLHFCAEKRKEVSETKTSLGEISKELARLWSEIKEDQEKSGVYYEIVAKDKKVYKEKKRKWEEECDELLSKASSKSSNSLKKEKGRKVKSTSTKGPKKPRSAYLYFCSAIRQDVKNDLPSSASLGDISKELARRWAETAENNEEGREIFKEMASKDKARYYEELKNMDTAPTNDDTLIGRPKKSRKTKSTAKVKRAPSAYILFCKAKRQDIVDESGNKLSFGETTKKLATIWKECDEKTRNKYEKESNTLKEKMMK